MKEVIELVQTCYMCPEQYEGKLDTGEKVYVRYRWGHGRLDIDDNTISEINTPADPFKGYFDEGELEKLFNQANIKLDIDIIQK